MKVSKPVIISEGKEKKAVERVRGKKEIKENSWYSDNSETILCFNLEKGLTTINLL